MINEQVKIIHEVAQKVNGQVNQDKGIIGIICRDDTECVVQAARKGLPIPAIENKGNSYLVFWNNMG